jgi:hypothetical protein
VIYIVDIDDTICVSPLGKDGKRDYTQAVPLYERIAKINALFDEGHEIHYWTARGMATNRNFTKLTKQQLIQWGCKFHSVKMRKPKYDKWIDDKAMNAEDL